VLCGEGTDIKRIGFTQRFPSTPRNSEAKA
jgi:hypothetical protein